MKSSISVTLIVLISIGIELVTLPCHAVTKNSDVVAEEIKPLMISMESFRADTLDHQATLKLVTSCLEAGQYQNAEEVADKLLVSYPDDEEILRKAVWAFEGAGHPKKSLPLYTRLLLLHPNDTFLAIGAARVYSWTGNFAYSLQLYAKAIKSGINSGPGISPDVIMGEYADVLYWDKQYASALLNYRPLAKKGVLQKQQIINFAHTLIAMKENDAAEEQINALALLYPDDNDVLQATADLSFALNRYERASALYREMIAKNPDNPLFYNKLADVEVAKKNYAGALKISNETLQRFPDNKPAMLMIARVSSWQKDYPTSLAFYDKLIASGESASNNAREKARVLGWINEYDRALAVYQEALGKNPQDQALKAEADAKTAYYHNASRSAVKAYKTWLKYEPDQPDALSDLGQIYMQYGQWEHASNTYDSLLAKIPDLRSAIVGKEKAEISSSMILLRSGTEYSSVKSDWNKINVTYTDFYTSLSAPFENNLSAYLAIDNKSYHFEENSVTQKSITTGLEYTNLPDISLRSAYGFHQTSGNNSNTGFLEAESVPVDNVHLALSFHHEDVNDNFDTFQNKLNRNRWQGRVVYDGYRFWNAGIDYNSANYSDNRNSKTVGVDVTAHLLNTSQLLNLSYRLQNYSFSESEPETYYWTPSSFTTHSLGLEWRHYLNEERTPGTNDIYYSTTYKISLEPDGNMAHTIHAGLNSDWNARFSTLIECQYVWATKYFYQNKLLKADIQWFF